MSSPLRLDRFMMMLMVVMLLTCCYLLPPFFFPLCLSFLFAIVPLGPCLSVHKGEVVVEDAIRK